MKKILTLLLAISLIICAVGCQPKVDPNQKSDGVMTHAEYMAAAVGDDVVIEGFVQAKQSWWNNKGTFYLQDGTGGYFIYEMPCTESEYESLVPGTKIQVTGKRADYAGMDEVASVTDWKIVGTDTYIATPKNLTDTLANEAELKKCNGMLAAFDDMTVVSVTYKNGTPGDDIYVKLSKGGVEYDFCIEVYLTGTSTDVYAAVGELVAGDVIDVEGFVYWYNGINTHITKVTK